MTLEEIESMELTYELIEQAQKATPENIARITLLTARMLLDYCDGDREMAKEQVQRDYEGQTPIHGAAPNLLRLLLKSIDALADFRAKKAANPHADQSKGLTATEETAKALRQQG